MSSSVSFSALQNLLQLSYSAEAKDQQRAAIELSNLVEGNVFPAVSFGPLAHALCRLIPSTDRTVTSYSARALKILLLDDALRPQAGAAGVPTVVCTAIKQWEDEVLCLRQLLGALQTLCWDKACVKGVLHADIVFHLIDYIQASDQDVSTIALCTLCNILYYSDNLLLPDLAVVDALCEAMPLLLHILRESHYRPKIFYAAAAVANASRHPRLASLLKDDGGLQIMRELEAQSLANLHTMGSNLSECAQVSIYLLSDGKESGSSAFNTSLLENGNSYKYSYKYGNQAQMELTLDTVVSGKYKQRALVVALVIWALILFYTFTPAFH